MTTKEIIEREKALLLIEEDLKACRDFEGLIIVYEELMKLVNSNNKTAERISQKAYCLARLGRKIEAARTLEGLRAFSFSVDKNKLFRLITLVSFFLSNSASDLNSIQLNTIKGWLKNPKASEEVLQIVFDYSDFIENIKPFDNSILQKKQTYFSSELQECVFTAMQRYEFTKIYYNRGTNDIQQEVQGYLTSQMVYDKSLENRILANRIMNSDSTDPIIEGLHFLIPRLTLSNYLEKFSKYVIANVKLIDFIDKIESSNIELYGEDKNSITGLFFDESVSNIFFTELEIYYKNNDIKLEELKGILTRIRKGIAIEYLNEVNK